jgi:hypothetical protein
MSRLALNLVRPLAERLREQAPIQPAGHGSGAGGVDWPEIERNTCSILELAAVCRISEPAACNRVARGQYRALEVPSRKRADDIETRVTLRSLPKSLQRAIRRLRNLANYAARSMNEPMSGPHHGGAVLKDDDGRLALTLTERKVVEGLYLKRYEPGPGHLMHRLVRDCIRCHRAPMRQLVLSSRGRYGQWRCANQDCGLEFGYATIRRICLDVPPEAATLARKGVNAYVNKHGVYRPQPAANFHRNERVYGDHHKLDIWSWDERDPARKLRREIWFSYWGDKATGVGAWRCAWRANADLLALAFRSYVQRWGLPEEAWTDNGKDYISAQFTTLCAELGVALHHTLPSKRDGESHGKSKPVERFFGTLERDFIKTLPGWCGTHPKERPDDALFPQQQQHEAFARRERKETPFLSFQQIEKTVRAWNEQHFLITPSATADAAPSTAFTADSHPVQPWGTGVFSERAFDVLMMRAKTRVVGRNGVSVDGRMYWSVYFAGMTGMKCTVRWDPGDIGQVVVSVHQKGKADQIIIATSEAWRDLAESNYERFREIKKGQLRHVKDYLADRHQAAEGVTPYAQMLLEAHEQSQASEMPLAAAVNGEFGPSTSIITEGHRLAAAIAGLPHPGFSGEGERAPKVVSRGLPRGPREPEQQERLPVRLPQQETAPEALPFRMPDYTNEGRFDADKESPPEGEGVGETD